MAMPTMDTAVSTEAAKPDPLVVFEAERHRFLAAVQVLVDDEDVLRSSIASEIRVTVSALRQIAALNG